MGEQVRECRCRVAIAVTQFGDSSERRSTEPFVLAPALLTVDVHTECLAAVLLVEAFEGAVVRASAVVPLDDEHVESVDVDQTAVRGRQPGIACETQAGVFCGEQSVEAAVVELSAAQIPRSFRFEFGDECVVVPDAEALHGHENAPPSSRRRSWS